MHTKARLDPTPSGFGGGWLARLVPLTLFGLYFLSYFVFLEFYYISENSLRIHWSNGLHYFEWLAVGVALLAGSFLLFKNTTITKFETIEIFRDPLVILLFIWGASFSLSSLFGVRSDRGFRLLGYILLFSLPMWLLGVSVAKNKNADGIVWVITSIVACFGLFCFFVEYQGAVSLFNIGINNYLWGGQRWSFLFQEANGFGMLCALGFTSAFVLFVCSGARLRLILTPVIVCFIFLVIKSGSRGALVWLFSVCCALVIINSLKFFAYRKLYLKPVVLATASLVLFLILSVYLFYLYSPELRLNVRTNGRMEVWLYFVELIKENPVFGFGYAGSKTILKHFYSEVLQGRSSYHMSSPLNSYIGIWAEAGFCALLSVILLWLGAVKRALQVLMGNIRVNSKFNVGALFVVLFSAGAAVQQNFEFNIMRISFIHLILVFVIAYGWSLKPSGDSNIEISK